MLPEIKETLVSMPIKESYNSTNRTTTTNMNNASIDNYGINDNMKQSSDIHCNNNNWDTKYSNDNKELQNNQINDFSIAATSPQRSTTNSISVKNDYSTLPFTTTTTTTTAIATRTPISSPSSQAKTTIPSSASSASSTTTRSKCRLPSELEYDKQRMQHVDDEYRLKLIKNANMKSILKNGWKLLPHQKSGVLKGLLMRRLVLAFDMGLGKTLIACVWAKAFIDTFDGIKVYIIAPVSIKDSWKKTALDATGLKCKEVVKQKKVSKQKTKTKKKMDETGTTTGKSDDNDYDIEIFSWAKVPPAIPKSVKHFVVICDEAHNMQSMESARTKDTLGLVLEERCKGVLLLTGTPMKNGKPSNLFPLLKAARHPFGDDQRLYETFFCNGQQKNYGGRSVWDASGQLNLGILKEHITSHVFYKTKDECLRDLPSKTREYKKVPVSSRFELQHNRALLEMAQVQKSLDSLERDKGNEAILGAFSRVRLIAALAKIDATVALAKNVLQKESSVVIFSYFVEVAKQVHKKLNDSGWTGELLVGETPSKNRQALVDRFQAGISPVFVATFGAGGVGITLTAACTIILLDRPWTPGDALQAEDRVRRIGQTRPVKSIWLRAFQVDEQVDNLIDYKSMNSSAVMSGNGNDNNANQSRSAPRMSVRELIRSIVDKNDELRK